MTQKKERTKSSNRDEVPHLFLILGAGVTPAEGSVKPTEGFTFNEVDSDCRYSRIGITTYVYC
jgi:hypothetical protein